MARSSGGGEVRDERSLKLSTARDLKDTGDRALSTVANAMHAVGDDYIEKNKLARDALDRTIRDAAVATYGKTQDPLAAQAAAEDAAGKWLTQR